MDVATKIETFNILFYVSMAVAILGLGMSIYFFFHYDIPSVWSFLTGSAKRKAIEEMKENDYRPGSHAYSRIRQSSGKSSQGTRRPAKQKRPAPRSAQPRMEDLSDSRSAEMQADETDVLSVSTETDVLAETSALNIQPVLKNEGSEIQIRQDAQTASTEQLSISNAPASLFHFEITENTLVIHTDEYI